MVSDQAAQVRQQNHVPNKVKHVQMEEDRRLELIDFRRYLRAISEDARVYWVHWLSSLSVCYLLLEQTMWV